MNTENKKWNFKEALEKFNNDPTNDRGRKLYLDVKQSANSVQMELSVTPFPITGPEYKGGVIVKETRDDGTAFQGAEAELINHLFFAASYGFEKMQELSFGERQKLHL